MSDTSPMTEKAGVIPPPAPTSPSLSAGAGSPLTPSQATLQSAPPPSVRLSAGPPSNARWWHRPLFLAISAAVAVAVVLAAHDVMLPFVLAIVIAYVLTPLVAAAERRGMKRGAAILLVYAVVLAAIGTFVWTVTPRVAHEIGNLRREAPAMADEVRASWIPAMQARLRALGLAPPPAPPEPAAREAAIVARPREDGSFAIDVGTGLQITQTKTGFLVEPVRKKEDSFDPNRMVSDAVGKTFSFAQENALELARFGRAVVAGISRVIFVFFITLMLAAYTMLTRERIFAFLESLVRPSSRQSFGSLVARVDRGLSGVVRGQLVICLVNGALSAVGFAMVQLKYWPVLALIATVLSLIPIFGSIISSVPAVALGLTQGLGTALFVLGWIVAIHQLEANFLNPKIMGDAAKIHPVLVVFSLLVGEHFFHTAGALLAVPCMSIAQSVFIHFRQIVQKTDPELAGEPVGSIVPPPPPFR